MNLVGSWSVHARELIQGIVMVSVHALVKRVVKHRLIALSSMLLQHDIAFAPAHSTNDGTNDGPDNDQGHCAASNALLSGVEVLEDWKIDMSVEQAEKRGRQTNKGDVVQLAASQTHPPLSMLHRHESVGKQTFGVIVMPSLASQYTV